MAGPNECIYVDDEVSRCVLAVIKEARDYVIVVTPFLKLWGHARNAIEDALGRGIKLTFILRAERDKLDEAYWLKRSGAKVLCVDRLHAKIYLNESSVVVSSMNLVESSAQNSLEIALIVTDSSAERQLRDYVANTIIRRAVDLNDFVWGPAHHATQEHREPAQMQATGTCIRCGRKIALNTDRPLCQECYEEWANWGNVEYPEVVCHYCGRPAEVSYAKPLCNECFHRL